MTDTPDERAALTALADAFGTPDSPVTVQYVRAHQPAHIAEPLTEAADQIARGRARTRRWVARVHKASTRRATRAANTNNRKR
jgi:hypothetical protein